MKEQAKQGPQIGITGVGMVGGALLHHFHSQKVKPLIYDPPKGLGSVGEINRAQIIFICVPTPFDKQRGFEMRYVEDSIRLLSGEKIIVIKSTVVPGTTARLQQDYAQHRFLFNPEFLVEERALKNMMKPDRQIVGYTNQSKAIAPQILSLLPRAPFEKIIPAAEAEMIKYFGNVFLAIKVTFGNQMYDLCQKLGIDYEIVRECASADPRIGPSHLDVHHGGYRGYGGKCLPKDIRALIQLADMLGIDLKLPKVAEEINNQLMELQGIEDPEKFSKRGL